MASSKRLTGAVSDTDIDNYITANPTVRNKFVTLSRGIDWAVYYISDSNNYTLIGFNPNLTEYDTAAIGVDKTNAAIESQTITIFDNSNSDKYGNNKIMHVSHNGIIYTALAATIDDGLTPNLSSLWEPVIPMLPEKNADDIDNNDDVLAAYKPMEIKKAIERLALTPGHSGLIENGGLKNGSVNFSISGVGEYLTKDYAAKFGSQNVIVARFYRRLESVKTIAINPLMSYELGFSVMAKFDPNKTITRAKVYPFLGFRDANNNKQFNGWVYVQNENKPMTVTEDAPVGSTVIKVDNVQLEPADGLNQTLKLPLIKDGIDYSGTTYSYKFITSNYTNKVINFTTSVNGGTQIFLNSPSLNALSAGDVIYQSKHDGTYAYVAPTITYGDGVNQGKVVDPSDVGIINNTFPYIYRAAHEKLLTFKWSLSGIGQKQGQVPLGVYGLFIGALLNYSATVDTGVEVYVSNMFMYNKPKEPDHANITLTLNSGYTNTPTEQGPVAYLNDNMVTVTGVVRTTTGFGGVIATLPNYIRPTLDIYGSITTSSDQPNTYIRVSSLGEIFISTDTTATWAMFSVTYAI